NVLVLRANAIFIFKIDTTGQITQVFNPDAATANGNTITFKTAIVHIDPQNYPGSYDAPAPGGRFVGPVNAVYVTGLPGEVLITSLNSLLRFTLTADTITSSSGSF